jgi:Bacterial Ig-like domain (group 3)
VKFTATLTSNGGLPAGGKVTFTFDGTTLGTATISAGGAAVFSTAALPHGSDTVNATYAGNSDYSAALASVIQEVN